MASHTFPVSLASDDPSEQLVAVDVELGTPQGSFAARLIVDTGSSRVLLRRDVIDALQLPVASRNPWLLTTAAGVVPSPVYSLSSFPSLPT